MEVIEGHAPFVIPDVKERCRTYYKTFGNIRKNTPLVFIHGGPGAAHDHYSHLGAPLHAAGIPTIFYDQIGCGRSSRLTEKDQDESFWSFDVFIAELDSLIEYLSIRETGFHIHGHSWGGQLASIYAGRQPVGLKCLILANSSPSAAIHTKQITKLFLQDLHVDNRVMQIDVDGDYDNPVYQEVVGRFNKKYFCRLNPWPEALTSVNMDDATRLWNYRGKENFSRLHFAGFLSRYDSLPTADNIKVPTLLITSGHDWNDEEVMRPWFENIKTVKWVVLKDCSHMAALEEPEEYIKSLSNFLL